MNENEITFGINEARSPGQVVQFVVQCAHATKSL